MANTNPGGYIILDLRGKIDESGGISDETAAEITAACSQNVPILYIGPAPSINESAYTLSDSITGFVPVMKTSNKLGMLIPNELEIDDEYGYYGKNYFAYLTGSEGGYVLYHRGLI